MSPPARSILIRGVNWLGDAVMTIPALHRLREAHPEARITLLSPAKLQDLWRRHPAIDQVTAFQPGEGVWSIGRRLRPQGFDLAIVLPNSPRSAFEVWLAGARRRIGYARPWRRWLLTRVVPSHPGYVPMRKRSRDEIQELTRGEGNPASQTVPTEAHHLFHYLYLASAAGANASPLAPYLLVADDEMTQAAARFDLASPADALPWIGLNAGAEYGPAKRWPLERFVAVAEKVQNQTPCHWLVLGGPGDRPLAADLEARLKSRLDARPPAVPARIVNLAGKTTLRELCALLKSCRVLLTNDSGPMHVAAAVGTPVVVPFGSTSAALTGPGLPGDPRHALVSAHAPCSPCFLRECPIDFRCMNGIAVATVAAEVLKRVR